MKKTFRFLSFLFTIILIVVLGVSCNNEQTTDPTPDPTPEPTVDAATLVAEAKSEIEKLEIPSTVTGSFDNISLYEPTNENVTVEYNISANAADYLSVADYTLSYVAMPEEMLNAQLTASISATADGTSANDSVAFNITLDPTVDGYVISIKGINGRNIGGALILFALNGSTVSQGETDNTGTYMAAIDADVYDVTIYLPTGFVFDNGTDTYTTKTEASFDTISLTCDPVLIEETAPNGTTYEMGDQAYDFSVETYNPSTGQWGNTWTLSEKLAENDLVVINFWYSTCTWCLREFPVLVSTYQEQLDAGAKITVLGITYSGADNESSVVAAARQYGLNFELTIADDLVSMFQVSGFPTTVFIDRYGTIDYIESGAITDEATWTNMYETYLAEDYEPVYKGSAENGGVEQVEPDVEFDASAIEEVLNNNGFEAEYAPETGEDATYSWPFVPSPSEEGAVIPANSGYNNSYAIMYLTIHLQAGQGFAFEYKAQSEADGDILYLIYDGNILNQFSGLEDTYSMCYPYVADTEGDYEFAFVYLKDNLISSGDDVVYLKNFRIINANEVENLLFVQREASYGDLNVLTGRYSYYVDAVYNPNDGYYHVGYANGPLLLADIYSASHFSNDALIDLATAGSLSGTVDGVQVDYNALMIRYAQYAVNSLTQGFTPVTEELRLALDGIARLLGQEYHENEWKEMTVYFNVYGDYEGDVRVDQETGEIVDPTVGLGHHNAIEVETNDYAEAPEKNTVVAVNEFIMDRFITTRGFYFAFTPKVSGVYLIADLATGEDESGAVTGVSTDCYVENADYNIILQANFETRDYAAWGSAGYEVGNYNLFGYLEAGVTYYIVPFYTFYGEYGDVSFEIRYVDSEAYVLEKASSYFYTTSNDFSDGDTSDIENSIISIANCEVELGSDGFYHQKYSDGTLDANPLYFDMIYSNMLIDNSSFMAVINSGVFDMSINDFGESLIDSEGYLLSWDYQYSADGSSILVDEDGEYIRVSTRVTFNGNPVVADTTIYRDWTADVRAWMDSDLYVSDETDAAYGCIKVNDDVKEFLELLMNKYSFQDIEGSWMKLCYYAHYYGATEHPDNVLTA